MELTYRYRLYPTEKQQKLIMKTCYGTRFLYNHLLSVRTEHFRKTGMWCELDYKAAIEQNMFLQEIDKSALFWSMKRLEQAYAGFFNRKTKKKERFRPEAQAKLVEDPNYQLNETDLERYPKFKKRKTIKQISYTTNAPDARIDHDRVFLPGVGFVKLKMHRALPEDMERILRYTVLVRPSGHVFLLVHFWMPRVPGKQDLHQPLGILFDPMRLAVRSDGVPVEFAHADPKLQKKIQKVRKEIKRSVRGSKAFEEKQRKLALLYEKQKNQRWDSLHKSTRRIANADDVDTVYIEAPSVMRQKREWAAIKGVPGMIQDESWWGFSELLRYKLRQQGKYIWRVDAAVPVRDICCNCQAQVKIVPWQDPWVCPHCGIAVNSELNGALNLRAMADNYLQSRSEVPT